jgi:hypothetical protein
MDKKAIVEAIKKQEEFQDEITQHVRNLNLIINLSFDLRRKNVRKLFLLILHLRISVLHSFVRNLVKGVHMAVAEIAKAREVVLVGRVLEAAVVIETTLVRFVHFIT